MNIYEMVAPMMSVVFLAYFTYLVEYEDSMIKRKHGLCVVLAVLGLLGVMTSFTWVMLFRA